MRSTSRPAFAPRAFASRWSTAVENAPWPNRTGASVSGTKKDGSWGSMDERRRARAQGALESSNAATGDREEDETNRAGASAKGGNSRHCPGSSPLTLRCCKSAAGRHERPGAWMLDARDKRNRWPAVEAYLKGAPMTGEQTAALRAYLRQWVAAPAIG
jgi:hypothetical protein